MTPGEIDARLVRSFEDGRLTRGERQALVAFVTALGPDADREGLARRAFDLARAAAGGPDAVAALDWLEDVLRALREPGPSASDRGLAEAHFSPGDDCVRAIDRLLRRARRSADVCVFTITDDRLADALVDAHGRGLAVRIISDDAKAEDLGSDLDRFARAGLATRVDRSPYHMHHKFAIVDADVLLTGSYNWTRGAARDNEENLILTDDPRLVSAFARTFESLWASLA